MGHRQWSIMNKNEQVDLDNLIQAYYGSQRMDDDVVDAVLNTSSRAGENRLAEPASNRGWSRRQWLKVAAIGVVAIGAGVSLERLVGQGDTREILLNELVLNHREPLELDTLAGSFEDVQVALTRLDFELRAPRFLAAGQELLGGRYCSLLGNLAVQLKLRDPATGRIDTLFLTPQTTKLSKLQAERTQIDGIEIVMGSEGGLFYGHTRHMR